MVIKKKYSKKGSIAFAAALLSGVAITSAVFAGWIIINGDTENATGTINVDTVETITHTIDLGTKTTGAFNFTAPKDYANGPEWLKVKKDDANSFENLTETFTVTVANSSDVTSISELFASIELTETTTGKYSAAVGHNYVCELPTFDVKNPETVTANQGNITLKDITTTSQDVPEGSKVFELKVQLAWGSAFNYMNPYNYAKALPESETKATFTSKLEGLYNDINGCTFNLKITTK